MPGRQRRPADPPGGRQLVAGGRGQLGRGVWPRGAAGRLHQRRGVQEVGGGHYQEPRGHAVVPAPRVGLTSTLLLFVIFIFIVALKLTK